MVAIGDSHGLSVCVCLVGWGGREGGRERGGEREREREREREGKRGRGEREIKLCVHVPLFTISCFGPWVR